MSDEHDEIDVAIDDRLFAGVWANHLRIGVGSRRLREDQDNPTS